MKRNYKYFTGTEGSNIEDLISGFDDRFEKLVEEIGKIVKNSGRILDVACGEGKIWKLFKNKGIYGIDWSYVNLKIAKSLLFPVRSDAQVLPFKNEIFDLVVASEIIEHLLNPQIMLEEINRVLKNKGYVIYTFPVTGALQLRLGLLLFGRNPTLNYPENKCHIRFYNLADLITMHKKIKDTNYKIVKVRGASFLSFHRVNFKCYVPVPRKIRFFGGDMFPNLALNNIVVMQKIVKDDEKH